jgi:hypothetical protein
MAVVSLVNLAAKIAALGVVFALGVFLAPLLQVLARRLFARLGHPLIGFAPVLLVLFLPAIAVAQELPGTNPAAPSAVGLLVAQYLPLVLLGLLTVLTGFGLPHLRTWLIALSQSSQHSAAVREFAAALLPVEHLAEVIASKCKADAQNGSLTISSAAQDLKAAIGDEGAADLKQVLGVGGDALTKYLEALIQSKLSGAQLSAATAAGAAAVTKVQAMPFNQVAAALAKS